MKEKKEVSLEKQIVKLASFGLNNLEISEVTGVDDSTLKRNFEKFLIKGRAVLKEKLKRKQIQVALGGNVVMLIWLGKQYLAQKERAEESGEFKINLIQERLEDEIEREKLKNECANKVPR